MPEESTTPDLVELSRQAFEAVIRRDFGALEGFYAPDAIYRGAQIGTFEGTAAIRGLFEDMLSPYEEFHGEIEEIVDLGNGVVFGVYAANGRPDGSSGVIQVRLASVLIWHDGVIERQTAYTDIDEARAAAERLAQERG
jgi:ketosteroid isomerase-like protein